MSRWLRLLSFLCVLGAADASGVLGLAVAGSDCGGVECSEGSADENCTSDCGLCPFCPLRAGAPEILVAIGETVVSSAPAASRVEPLADAVPVEVFRPPLA